MSTFYDIDPSHISLKEHWWWSRSPAVLITFVLRKLGTGTLSSSDDPNTESTLPFVVQELPQEVAFNFSALASEFTAMGFLDPIYHLIYDPGTRTTIYWATYRHESGNYFARIHQRIWQQAQKADRGLFPMFFTEFTDGTFLVSSSGKPDMDAPASVRMNRMPQASCAALWSRHYELTQQEAQRKMIAPVRSQHDLVATTERHHLLVRDFHLARKVFRVRTADEQAKAEAFAASVAQGQASGMQHPEVMAELIRLQEVKPAWRGAIWLLIGSIVAFFALGVSRWDWKFTLWLIPALFVHEAGHWIMMRIFKYRNLRMFFIPFFGAAVMGNNWNVAGWKKALVSLAGPVPSIALGFIMGVVGMALHRPPLIGAALVVVILNGINLLPILPLDGGRFMQAVLFSRNRWLDIVFRVLTIIGIGGLALVGLGKFLIYAAIPMAMYLPVAFKLGQATDSLRQANLPPPNPNDDRVPPQTADAIITEVKAALPKNVGSKALAQHTLAVFETLNARPPGVLATLALLAVYGGTIFISVVSAMVFLVAKEGRFGDFVKSAAHQPRHTLECGSVRSWHGEAATNDAAPRNLLVTTLNRTTDAQAAFTSLSDRLPETARLTLFGDSILVTLPSSDDKAREEWFDRLQMYSTNAFVAVSNRPVALTLMCIAPTSLAASNLEETLINDFKGPFGVRLIPPWSQEAKSAQFAAYEKARASWRKMSTDAGSFWTNAELKAISSKIVAARKRGAEAEVKRLMEEHQKVADELESAALEALKNQPGFDPELVELHNQFSKLGYANTNRAQKAALGRKIGVKLGEATDEKTAAFQTAASSGIVTRNGLMLTISWVSMDDPTVAAPALTAWLCEQGCVGMRYEFEGAFSVLDDDDM